MKLLVLGGTRFLGHHLVTAALAHDHDVTIFHRGQHPATNQPNVEIIYGDRHYDLERLQNQTWDAVIDTCGSLPHAVKASAEALANSVERYVYISSISAYANLSVAGVDETSPLETLTEEQLQVVNATTTVEQLSTATYGELYGGLKALCEKAVEETLPGRSLILRPGLIVGPADYTDRFTYWVARVARGGDVLAPGNPNRSIQFIDARDLAEWIIQRVEVKATGIYNASGVPDQLTMQHFLEQCKDTSKSDANFTWVSDEFLMQKQVTPWSELPLWIPDAMQEAAGLLSINCDKALDAGLKLRPIAQTIQAVLSWSQTHRAQGTLNAGLAPDKEHDLLRQWQETG